MTDSPPNPNLHIARQINALSAQKSTPKHHHYYYKILGFNESDHQKISQETIGSKYRKLCIQIHPDRNPGPDRAVFEEATRALNEAYSVLGDEHKRRQYDLGQAEPNLNYSQHMNGYSVNGFGIDNDDLNMVFNHLFRQHMRNARNANFHRYNHYNQYRQNFRQQQQQEQAAEALNMRKLKVIFAIFIGVFVFKCLLGLSPHGYNSKQLYSLSQTSEFNIPYKIDGINLVFYLSNKIIYTELQKRRIAVKIKDDYVKMLFKDCHDEKIKLFSEMKSAYSRNDKEMIKNLDSRVIESCRILRNYGYMSA